MWTILIMIARAKLTFRKMRKQMTKHDDDGNSIQAETNKMEENNCSKG